MEPRHKVISVVGSSLGREGIGAEIVTVREPGIPAIKREEKVTRVHLQAGSMTGEQFKEFLVACRQALDEHTSHAEEI
jgi:hypothetical protein